MARASTKYPKNHRLSEHLPLSDPVCDRCSSLEFVPCASPKPREFCATLIGRQRNTVRAGLSYQLNGPLGVGIGAEYGSGLPFECSGSQRGALDPQGPAVVAPVNFDRGGARTSFSLDVSAGVDIGTRGKINMRLTTRASAPAPARIL